MAASRPDLGPRTSLPSVASLGGSSLEQPDGLGPKTSFSTPSLGEPASTSTMPEAEDALQVASVGGLTLSDGTTSYDIKSCRINYAVNSIPAANVVLALGYDVDAKTMAAFSSGIAADTLWSINISGSTGGTKLSGMLFQGFLQGVGRQANRGAVGASYSLTLSFLGPAQAIARKAFNGYVFWNDETKGALMDSTGPRLLTDEELRQDLWEKGEMDKTAASDLAPAMVEMVDRMYTLLSYDKRTLPTLAQYFQAADKIGLQASVTPSVGGNAPTTVEHMITAVVVLLRQAMLQSNEWTAFQQVVVNMLLWQIIPRPTGFSLAPAFYWAKTPVYTLTGADVLGIGSQNGTTGSRDDYDTVFVQRMMTNVSNSGTPQPDGYIVYPPNVAASQAKALVTSMPVWLWATLQETTSATPGVSVKSANPGQRVALTTTPAADQDTSDAYAQKYAAMVYAAVKNASSMRTLSVPWYRFDLLQYLGYVIKVNGLATPAEIDDSASFYGALMGLTFSANIGPQSASVALTLDLSNVRNEEENEEFGLDEHPIYTVAAQTSSSTTSASGTAVAANRKPSTPAMNAEARAALLAQQRPVPPGYYAPGVRAGSENHPALDYY